MSAKFNWEDPFFLSQQLSDDELRHLRHDRHSKVDDAVVEEQRRKVRWRTDACAVDHLQPVSQRAGSLGGLLRQQDKRAGDAQRSVGRKCERTPPPPGAPDCSASGHLLRAAVAAAVIGRTPACHAPSSGSPQRAAASKTCTRMTGFFA